MRISDGVQTCALPICNETYKGGGLNLIWTPDRWTVSFDGSYSDSHRTETQKATRMRSNRRVGYTLTYLDDDVVPNVAFEDFDITDPDLFLRSEERRVGTEDVRRDKSRW